MSILPVVKTQDDLVTLELLALAHDGAVCELAVVEDVPDVRGQPGGAGRLRLPPSPSLDQSENDTNVMLLTSDIMPSLTCWYRW